MTLFQQITRSIAILNATLADVESAEKGKIRPSVRARREILKVAKELAEVRKDLLENAKAEKQRRVQERLANPKKRYATGFALKKKS